MEASLTLSTHRAQVVEAFPAQSNSFPFVPVAGEHPDFFIPFQVLNKFMAVTSMV